MLFIGGREFQGILSRYPGVARDAMKVVAARLRSLHDTVEALVPAVSASAKSRGSALVIQMPLSREELAELTGATRETASRVLGRFAAPGFIRSGRGWIAIIDSAGLDREA